MAQLVCSPRHNICLRKVISCIKLGGGGENRVDEKIQNLKF